MPNVPSMNDEANRKPLNPGSEQGPIAPNFPSPLPELTPTPIGTMIERQTGRAGVPSGEAKGPAPNTSDWCPSGRKTHDDY